MSSIKAANYLAAKADNNTENYGEPDAKYGPRKARSEVVSQDNVPQLPGYSPSETAVTSLPAKVTATSPPQGEPPAKKARTGKLPPL